MIGFMGYTEQGLIKIIEFWKNSKMNKFKQLMTRAEAVNLLKNNVFGIPDTEQAMKWADFFISAGMLEIREEEDKKAKLYKKLKEYISQEQIDQIWQEINEINS